MTMGLTSTRCEFGEVGPPWWDDAPAFLVGGGPSLIDFDFRLLEGRGHVLGINRSMFDTPCEAGITVDHVFVRNYLDRLCQFTGNLYLSVGNEWWKNKLPEVPNATYLRSNIDGDLSFDTNFLRKAATSGFAALNLAVLKRAQRIVLLGYDYGAVDGRHHYHNDYTWYHKAQDQSWYAWARYYPNAARTCAERGIEVLNASQYSRLTCFRKVKWEDL